MSLDVIVVGAGLGGLTSARDLASGGHRVTVLEARERVGGRIRTDTFPGTSVKVDMGAEWGSPNHHLALGAELRRYGLGFERPAEFEHHACRLGGRLRDFTGADARAGLSDPERAECDRALAILAADAEALGFEGAGRSPAAGRLDLAFSRYVDSLGLGAAVSEMIHALAFGFAGGDPHEYSAWMLLRELAGYESDPQALFGDDHRISGGSSSLPLAMAGELGDRIRLGARVSRIADDDRGVSVSTCDGDELRASAAVVAVPINVLAGIEFSDPEIRGLIAGIGGPHAGNASKVWMKASGVPPRFHGMAWPELPEAYGHGSDPDLVAAFGMRPAVGDPDSRSMEGLLRSLLPGVKVEEVFHHDWSTDPLSGGTWLAVRPGQHRPVAALRDWKSRIIFAGADLDTGWAGWMDGAVTSGRRAAAVLRSGSR